MTQTLHGGPGKSFYAFVTPFIIVIGLIGNIVSLKVFTCTRLRDLSASLYLIALSISDSCVLLTYVLLDWLHNGLPAWHHGFSVNIIHRQCICELFLFVSYVFRFVTVYLLVIFSVERYIAVCKPLQRQAICSKNVARKVILVVLLSAVLISFYKPLLSGLYPASNGPTTFQNVTVNQSDYDAASGEGAICTWNPRYENFHYVMELIYGLTITAIPFVLVTVFNLLILKQLLTKYFQSQSTREMFRKSKMRIELTVMVLAVSMCFICLNIPYFIAWTIQNLQTFNPDSMYTVQRNSDVLRVTRTIFSINYSINFFVYCLTGSYYRGVILNMLGCRPNRAASIRRRRAGFKRMNFTVEVKVNNNTDL